MYYLTFVYSMTIWIHINGKITLDFSNHLGIIHNFCVCTLPLKLHLFPKSSSSIWGSVHFLTSDKTVNFSEVWSFSRENVLVTLKQIGLRDMMAWMVFTKAREATAKALVWSLCMVTTPTVYLSSEVSQDLGHPSPMSPTVCVCVRVWETVFYPTILGIEIYRWVDIWIFHNVSTFSFCNVGVMCSMYGTIYCLLGKFRLRDWRTAYRSTGMWLYSFKSKHYLSLAHMTVRVNHMVYV